MDTVPKDDEEDSSVALAVSASTNAMIGPCNDNGNNDNYNDDDDDAKVSVTISVVLILVIVILLYCLVSKRDLSPCPSKSNFGRRYSNVAESMRRNMRWST